MSDNGGSMNINEEGNVTRAMSGTVTQALHSNVTRAMNAQDSNRLFLVKNIVFTGMNDTYEVLADRKIGLGGESLVYLASRKSDGRQVVAKIYDEFADTPASLRNRKLLTGFLSKNLSYKDTHIMPLLDYGEVEVEFEGHNFRKPIDIIPFCADGELKKCDYLMLKTKVIPETLKGLNVLHKSNLVHRDIKPNNIYMLDDTIVISDFGTSGEISIDNKFDFIGTHKKRGTLGYTAPEVWQGYAIIASDYYSLGCTIATLFKGEHVYQRFIDSMDETRINWAINKEGLPLDCSEAESDIQALVDALVIVDEKNRAGYDDVMSWISDSVNFKRNWKYKRPQEEELLGFDFMDKIYNDEAELTDAVLIQQDDAKRFLYRGIFSEFFKPRNPTLSDKIIDITESKDTAGNHDLGLAMFLHYLNTAKQPTCPIYWRGEAFGRLSDISSSIYNFKSNESSITSMLKDRFLSWKLKNTQGVSSEEITAVEEIEDIAALYPQLGYYTLMYRFEPDNFSKPASPDELFMNLTANNSIWYKKAQELLGNDSMFAYLVSVGWKENVFSLKEHLSNCFVSDGDVCDFMLIYQLFEGVCEDKEYVREHYLSYGPWSYLYWFSKNLGLYSFSSLAAKEIEKRIKSIKINKKMSISEIFKEFVSLRQHLKDFMAMFNSNYLLPYIGIREKEETTGITTKYTHAFFAEAFYGISVPVGYIKFIGR